MTKILQIDREAAADGCLSRLEQSYDGWQLWMSEAVQPIREGQQDDHYDVQAFASHREQATRELISVIEDCILQLEYVDDRFPTGSTPAIIARARSALTKANPDA